MEPSWLRDLRLPGDHTLDGELFWNGKWRLYELKLAWLKNNVGRKIILRQVGIPNFNAQGSFFGSVSELVSASPLSKKLKGETQIQKSDLYIEGPKFPDWFLKLVLMLCERNLDWIPRLFLNGFDYYKNAESGSRELAWASLKHLPFKTSDNTYRIGVYLMTVVIIAEETNISPEPLRTTTYEFWGFHQT